ncbi:MAG: hypothetical protein JWN42_871, partial [Candidatus Angelobacter sp.]|nr:hypothetical protein [Candidatus Angelobacter sp.]
DFLEFFKPDFDLLAGDSSDLVLAARIIDDH